MSHMVPDLPDGSFHGVVGQFCTPNEVAAWCYSDTWIVDAAGWQYFWFIVPDDGYDYYLTHGSVYTLDRAWMNVAFDFFSTYIGYDYLDVFSGVRYGYNLEYGSDRLLCCTAYDWFEVFFIKNNPRAYRSYTATLSGYKLPVGSHA